MHCLWQPFHVCVKGQLALLRWKWSRWQGDGHLPGVFSGSGKAKLPRGGFYNLQESWSRGDVKELNVQFCSWKSGLFAKNWIVRGHQEALLSPFASRLYLELSLGSRGLNLLVNELIPPNTCDVSGNTWPSFTTFLSFNGDCNVNTGVCARLPRNWVWHRELQRRRFVLYLNGNVTVGPSNDPRDGQRDLVLDGPGPIRADEARVLHLSERGPNEIQRLLQSVRVLRAGVQDVSSELDPRKDAIAGVDLVQRQQHGFQPLDPSFLVDHAAVLRPLAFVVHREQTSDHQVPVQDDFVFGRWRQPGAARQDSQYQQLQQEQVEWPVMGGVGRWSGGAR